MMSDTNPMPSFYGFHAHIRSVRAASPHGSLDSLAQDTMRLLDGLLYRQSKRRTRERYTQKAGSTNDVLVLRYALRA